MEDGDGDDDDSEPSSDLSDESDGMEDDEHDEGEEEGSEGQSIIDMLEEQQMEEQVDGADGWTTDSDSADEEEEIDDEVNEGEFLFPPSQFPLVDPDEQEMAYSEEEMDEGADIDQFHQVMGNIHGQVFHGLEDEEDDDDEDEDQQDDRGQHHHHDSFVAIERQGWRPTSTRSYRIRTDIFGDDFRRNIRSGNSSQFRTILIAVGLQPATPATALIHPMMVNAQAQPQQRSTRSMTRISQFSAGAPPDLLRSMEQLFGVQAMLTDLMEQLGEGQQTTISFELRSRSDPNGHNLMPRVLRMSRQLPGAPPVGQDEVPHPYKIAHEFMTVETSSRWQHAATMWYHSSAPDRAAIFEQPIFKLLEPAAIEEEKVRKAKEEADRKAADVAKKAKEEEDRRIALEEAEARAKAEAEAREREEAEVRAREEERQRVLAEEQAERERLAAEALIESSNGPVVAMDEIETSGTAPEQEERQPEGDNVEPSTAETSVTERVFTVMRGNRVDITGLGVDPEFLDALPEDMREEVLYQHIRERRAAAPPNQPSTLDPSFLEALPPDIRAELLEEEAAERQRQERDAQRQQAGQNAAPSGPVDLDPASFIASLEGPLRQAVLLDQDDEFLAQLPPHIAAEANAQDVVENAWAIVSGVRYLATVIHSLPKYVETNRQLPNAKTEYNYSKSQDWQL